jgi:hypothetical protein
MSSRLIPVQKTLPQPSLEYTSALGRWMAGGEPLGEGAHLKGHTHPWYQVMWLTGVDYFSTLGYQPGLALIAAGALAPIATVILVLVTLFGALPVYRQVSMRSYAGQGSIAVLESLLTGWKSKVLVLILLGFAATDFVITMTLSAADAAKHAVENPLLEPRLGHHEILVTLLLLTALAIVFLRGFKEAINVAAVATIPYLLLNLIVIVRCGYIIAMHPTLLGEWRQALEAKGDHTMLMLGALIIFPKLALGLSGFETGVSVMPLVDGGAEDAGHRPRSGEPPKGRIKNTRKLLTGAALIMSVMLILSSFVTALLIPEAAYRNGGPAAGRAIAFLAHRHLGEVFGTIYDLSTILILSLAGASAMAGLLNLIPRYLPRFGMAPLWATLSRPLVLVLFSIDVIVTLVFKADVEAQGGAYATGVLVLILSAAFAATLALWRERHFWKSAYCAIVTLVFAYTLADNCVERPDGLIIGSIFIVLLLTVSGVSRYRRSTEFRVASVFFTDEDSSALAKSLVQKKVHLVPIRKNTPEAREAKREEIRKYYQVSGPFLFVQVHLLDNRSEFAAPLEVHVERDGADYCADVYGAIAVANTIAYVSEMIDPISIFIGLTRNNLMSQSFRYLLFGEGETGLMVYTILLRYWEWTPEDDVRPLIFLMSD